MCTAALQAFNADGECISAFYNNDTATYCSGTCGALIETAFDSCPNVGDIKYNIYICIYIYNYY